MNAGDRVFEHRWQFYDGQHVIFDAAEHDARELQTAVVDGYRRFYSLRRMLRHLVRLRFGNALEHLWGWCTSTAGRRTRNRAYLQGLAAVVGGPQRLTGRRGPRPGVVYGVSTTRPMTRR